MKLLEVAKAICKDFNLKFVGESGFGAFKKTYHVISTEEKDYALKVFKSKKLDERTNREIDAMLVCSHPNVGRLDSVATFEYDGKVYLYLLEEFLSGGTLSDKIKNENFSIGEFHNVGLSLIHALDHISSHELVHRDIKPDNIMFRKDGKTPVIVDFGLVRDLNNESLTQTWLLQGPGSPYYSAPEQLNNQKELIDWKTDQFALGITFSLSLFGIHPYYNTGDSKHDVVTRLINKEKPNTEFVQLCNDNNLSLLTKMVAPWPIDRYRTVEQLLDAWENIKEGGS